MASREGAEQQKLQTRTAPQPPLPLLRIRKPVAKTDFARALRMRLGSPKFITRRAGEHGKLQGVLRAY